MAKTLSYTSGGGGSFFKPDEGSYPAIVVGVIELGTEEKDYKNDGNIKEVEEIGIVYEIEAPQEKYDKDKGEGTGEFEDTIGTVTQNYTTIVSDNSKLGKVIKNIYDVDDVKKIKNFSMDKLIGKRCVISIELKGQKKNFPVVTSVAKITSKMEKLLHKQKTEGFYFGMDDPNEFDEDFETNLRDHLPTWEMDRIKASPEYKNLLSKFGLDVEGLEDNIDPRKVKSETQNEEEVSADDVENLFDDNGEEKSQKEDSDEEDVPFG